MNPLRLSVRRRGDGMRRHHSVFSLAVFLQPMSEAIWSRTGVSGAMTIVF
jgi:hypothetical protein